jgi:hypothetical protein
LNGTRSGLEENAARTAAQVERPEILHCLREQGNLRLPRLSLKNFSETEAESGFFFAAVIFLVRFWIEPKMNVPSGKGESIHWRQYGLQKRNQSSGN